MKINCPISIGELLDKYSILLIKENNINDSSKLENIIYEQNELKKIFSSLKDTQKYIDELININSQLWKVEDLLRKSEAEKKFNNEFIKLARSVYVLNDKRFSIKTSINKHYNSDITEEKEYVKY